MYDTSNVCSVCNGTGQVKALNGCYFACVECRTGHDYMVERDGSECGPDCEICYAAAKRI